MKDLTTDEIKFLIESNAIENVYDDDSLKQAIKAWQFLREEKKITIPVILKTYKILMKNHKIAQRDKGHFRQEQVWVGGREGIRWEKIMLEMENWIVIVNRDMIFHEENPYGFESYKNENKDQLKKENDKFLADVIKKRHIFFEKIHPFVDGNGRIGRMLLNWERIQMELPILVIYSIERQKYYEWFK